MNQPPMAIPAPQELIKKLNKEDPVMLSLRVKPSTKQFFEELANSDKGLSTNTLINELLESYADYYSHSRSTVKTPVSVIMREYLYAVAERIQDGDDESLITYVYNHKRMVFLSNGASLAEYIDTVAILDEIKANPSSPNSLSALAVIKPLDTDDSTDLPTDTNQILEFICTNHLPKGKKASYTPDDMEAKPGDDPYYEFRDIGVTPEYWAVVVTMGNAYLNKLAEIQPTIRAVTNTRFNRLLVDVINDAKNREDLAKLLAEAFAKFLEDTVDD